MCGVCRKKQKEGDTRDAQEIAVEYNDKVIYPDKVRINRCYLHHYSFAKDWQMILCTVFGKKMEYGGEVGDMKEEMTFDKSFWKSFGWFLLIALVICCLPWLLTRHLWIDFSSTGEIGDTIGGIMGPFIAIAAAGLTFIAFWVQYKANIQQRHDIAIERFESNLFEMIHIQQEIINGLLIEKVSSDIGPQRGRDVFQYVYETADHRIWLGDECKDTTLRHALEISDEPKMTISSLRNMWFLDHYYRYLFRIFKYIDDADKNVISDEKKYEYTGIVRATLSQYELIMLFYSAFSNPKFKNLIEKYALLQNLRMGLLASQADITLYGRKLSPKYSYKQDEDRNMELEYRKSAFVHQRYNSADE